MAQHISVRVPWHDNGWNGCVCNEPGYNNACLRLKNIYENRNDKEEMMLCGKCMEGYEETFPCISEGAAFMSDKELVRTIEHPYKKRNYATHGHFLPTDIVYPPYSFPARPFAWMMKERIKEKAEQFGIDYDPSIEPTLSFKTDWIQEARNHRAIFNYFYSDIVPDKSICIAYAKQVPFVEDSRRVVVAMGHVKKVIPAVEHAHTTDKPLRSQTWETHICHSIRTDHKDGFVIPYQQMMEYAELHPDFDMESITVFAPSDAFEQFSYASEHLSHDAVIEVILSCIKAFTIINDCLDEDYSNVLEWLNAQLAEVWEDRGAFPGLGAMLCALEIPLGMLIAKELKEKVSENANIWEEVDKMFDNPTEVFCKNLAKNITPIAKKTWKALSDERRTLFELLSRFSLSIDQARVLFHESSRVKEGIICSDREIIENPYILYEKTRLKSGNSEKLYVSVRKVDMAVFPVPSISERYPLEAPAKLTSDNDERRIRAIAIDVLENEALAGNTILPCDLLVTKMQNLMLDPPCKVTGDILIAIEKHLSGEILKRKMKNGTEYYKLNRIHEFDTVIEKRIKKRLKRSNRLDVKADWGQLLIDKFGVPRSNLERDGFNEKKAALEELSCSRIGVLIGDAGTGKTTVLSIMCNQSDIKAGGVLLLAPTGKATVRLMESMGEVGKDFVSLNVAQFLVRSKRFDWDEMRYTLSGQDYRDVPETVIIDEASMLTEEMFGALMEALRFAKRIIFVGDPNQLPPIGAGRPFVDLVRVLKLELKPGTFPKVCNCYGELTINFRQQSEGERMDVELSKFFTNAEDIPKDDILTAIEKGESKHIRVVKWQTKEELEKKILQVMASELDEMKDVDDLEGFDLALGGTKKDYGIFFDMGCANAADKWQILAPVRNMPQGVININRLIHMKYREHFLEVAKRWGRRKRIPKMLGPENIIYGDKVINVKNMIRDAWPQDGGARNYIANGEIGIACASYSVDKPNDYLHVEFSSQKKYNYSYDKKDFDEESGTVNLELAYALTVHKAQGSQFGTVILVLAEPCRIISRELLYTALTRQVKNIVILYNQDTYHLMNYASAVNSDIAKRLTDLFADVFEEIDTKPNVVEVNGHFYEEGLIHRTIAGDMVRSKAEVIIADCLHYNGLMYKYEEPLKLGGQVKCPDFTIIDPDTDDVWYWEHCGMMTDARYRRRWEDKKAFYEKNGIKEGKNLIVTYDDERGGLDSAVIDKLIKDTFNL